MVVHSPGRGGVCRAGGSTIRCGGSLIAPIKKGGERNEETTRYRDNVNSDLSPAGKDSLYREWRSLVVLAQKTEQMVLLEGASAFLLFSRWRPSRVRTKRQVT